MDGKTGGGVRGADSAVGSSGGVSILEEGLEASADDEREAAENRSRGEGPVGGVDGRASCDRLDVVADPLRFGVACKSIGKAMKTSFPVGWSRDKDKLMDEAVPGAVAIDFPEDNWTGFMAAPLDGGPAVLVLVLELVSLGTCRGRRIVTFQDISPSSSLPAHRLSSQVTSTSYPPLLLSDLCLVRNPGFASGSLS